MEWNGPAVRIEIIDEVDKLLVRSTGVRRLSVVLLYCAVIAVMAYIATLNRSLLFAGLSLLALCVGVLNVLRIRHCELCVTESELEAKGNLGQLEDSHVRLRWSAVSSFGYNSGGEDYSSGLYAGVTIVMADANEEQCLKITSAISRKFPNIKMAQPPDSWSLFDSASDLTTLGLSKPEDVL